VEEIASKFASANFQNFCRLASKKSAESAVFFNLEGTLATTHMTKKHLAAGGKCRCCKCGLHCKSFKLTGALCETGRFQRKEHIALPTFHLHWMM